MNPEEYLQEQLDQLGRSLADGDTVIPSSRHAGIKTKGLSFLMVLESWVVFLPKDSSVGLRVFERKNCHELWSHKT